MPIPLTTPDLHSARKVPDLVLQAPTVHSQAQVQSLFGTNIHEKLDQAIEH